MQTENDTPIGKQARRSAVIAQLSNRINQPHVIANAIRRLFDLEIGELRMQVFKQSQRIEDGRGMRWMGPIDQTVAQLLGEAEPLPACPLCGHWVGGFMEQNPRTMLYVAHVQCMDPQCSCSIHCCGVTEEESVTKVLERWNKRAANAAADEGNKCTTLARKAGWVGKPSTVSAFYLRLLADYKACRWLLRSVARKPVPDHAFMASGLLERTVKVTAEEYDDNDESERTAFKCRVTSTFRLLEKEWERQLNLFPVLKSDGWMLGAINGLRLALGIEDKTETEAGKES